MFLLLAYLLKIVDKRKLVKKSPAKNDEKKVSLPPLKHVIPIVCKTFVYIMLFAMYAPILVLILFSFTNATLIGNWNGFSLELYFDLFQDEEVLTAFFNTVIVAVTTGIVSTALGTLGAIGIFYSSKRVRGTFDIIGQIPVLNPEIVTALSLTILFVALGIKFNFVTLLIGHVVLTIPFVVLSITPKLKQLDPHIYEAALDLGAKPAKALRKVIIPEILPGILSGFLLSVTLSLDDYIITAFTKNPSFITLSTYVYGITAKKGALPPMLRALTTIIFLITLGMLVIVNIYNRKNNKRGGQR